MKTGEILIVVSYVIGALNLVTLVTQHPIQVSIFGFAALLWFVGKNIK